MMEANDRDLLSSLVIEAAVDSLRFFPEQVPQEIKAVIDDIPIDVHDFDTSFYYGRVEISVPQDALDAMAPIADKLEYESFFQMQMACLNARHEALYSSTQAAAVPDSLTPILNSLRHSAQLMSVEMTEAINSGDPNRIAFWAYCFARTCVEIESYILRYNHSLQFSKNPVLTGRANKEQYGDRNTKNAQRHQLAEHYMSSNPKRPKRDAYRYVARREGLTGEYAWKDIEKSCREHEKGRSDGAPPDSSESKPADGGAR